MITIKASRDSIGNWNGQEESVLYNLNRLRAEIYDRMEGAPDTEIEEAFNLAWDLWGSDDTLMGDLSDAHIQRMADRIV